MALTNKKTFIFNLSNRETASNILDRVIGKINKDAKAEITRPAYFVREFSRDESLDINGSEHESPRFSVDTKLVNLIKTKESLAQNVICRQIEYGIGAPYLAAFSISSSKLKLRANEEVSLALAKYKRREAFELKSLREMCEEINKTQNPSTKAAIDILLWLSNDGKGRSTNAIAEKLYWNLFAREKDKLFYIRRHPKQGMLHCCNDAAILERIHHLDWMFIENKPFQHIKRFKGAISTLH